MVMERGTGEQVRLMEARIMKKIINSAAQTVTFRFDTLPGEATLAEIVLELGKMSQANLDYATLHGMSARIGDKAALQKSAENGFKVTEAMRRAEVLAAVAHYHDPDAGWELASTIAKVPQDPAFVALAAALGCTYKEAMAKAAAIMLAQITAGATPESGDMAAPEPDQSAA